MTGGGTKAPVPDDAIAEALKRVRMAIGRGEDAAMSDVALLLARVDALELGLAATREFIASQPEDVFGYIEEGDPQVAVSRSPMRDYEIWCIDQVLKHGMTLGGRRHADRYEAQFDVMAPKQEELVISFCNEIGDARERGVGIDPVRLLEMARALYEAEMDDARLEIYPDGEKQAALRTLDRIMAGLEGLPEGDWTYRPNSMDDWGMVRNLDGEGQSVGFVANTRSGSYQAETPEALAAHRNAGTDPFEPVGRHLANCNPAAVRKVLALVRHLENEVRRLSALDRQYARVESWIIMNTEFDGNSKATDGGDRLIRHLESLKRRADSAGRARLR